MSLRLISSKH